MISEHRRQVLMDEIRKWKVRVEQLQAENEQLRARVKRLEEEDKKSLGLLWERHHD